MPRMAVVVVGGLAAQVLVTVASVFIPSADDRYGAPLSVGLSCFDLPIMRCGTTFDPLPFVVNIAITAAIWYLLARFAGVLGAVVAILGAFIAVALIPLLLAYNSPVVGLPVPLRPQTGIPAPWVVLVDVLTWAAIAATLTRMARRQGDRGRRASH